MENADALIDAGLAALARGAFAEALAAFDGALAARPEDLDALYNRAAALQGLGRLEEAVAAYDLALKRAPDVPDILFNRAETCLALGRFDQAAADLERLLMRAPHDAEALGLLQEVRGRRGGAHLDAGRFEGALEEFDAILRAEPENAPARVQRGFALLGLARLEESVADFEAGLARDPKLAAGHYGLGLALFQLGRRDEGLARLDAYRDAAPNEADPLFAKAVRLLSLGRCQEAWPLYERRWYAPIARMGPRRDHDEPAWNGRHIEGLVRLWAEQGPGDQILYARFIAEALQRTPRVAYACAPRFAALIERSFPTLERVAAEQDFAMGAAQAQAPLASLCALFDVAPEYLDGAPYLYAAPARRAALRARYQLLAGGKKIIGISWASSNAMSGALKSAPLAHWGALLSEPYVFVNLQYGEAAGQARSGAHGALIIDDPQVDQLTDMDAFAAQIAACDAVVSISNTSVHVAGALGVPCVAMPPPAGGLYWYWGLEGETTPWYRGVRLARRARGETWETQIARAALALRAIL